MHSDSLELANDAVLKVMLVHRQYEYRAKQITGVYTISRLLLNFSEPNLHINLHTCTYMHQN